MSYRGIPGMKVHLYRWGELRRELRVAGFQIEEVLPLDEVSAALIDAAWFLLVSARGGGSCLRRGGEGVAQDDVAGFDVAVQHAARVRVVDRDVRGRR